MSNLIDISIIIPCYNEEETIKSTLETIYTYMRNMVGSYEVILVIEKSTDKTLDVVKNIRNPETFVLENERKEGKGYSLKKGIKKARGKFILLCDADLPVEIEKYFLPMYLLLQEDNVAVNDKIKMY